MQKYARIKALRHLPGLTYLALGVLRDERWLESRATRVPRNRDGLCPWFVYGAVDFLKAVVPKNARVLEIGSGYSTIWWAQRECNVLSIEVSQSWAESISSKLHEQGLHDRVRILIVEGPNQITHALENYFLEAKCVCKQPFDVVVIDGLEPRSVVAELVVPYLDAGGIIVWDNSDRVEYEEGLSRLLSKGFGSVVFKGLGPINAYSTSTTILSRSPIELLPPNAF